MESIRRGLSADSRGARDAAEQAARVLAQRDPAGVEGLWASLDGRGRRLLIRALASAGYIAILADSDNSQISEQAIVESMKSRRIEGLILATAHIDDPLVPASDRRSAMS